jgi:SAM-dependent methyltransferase
MQNCIEKMMRFVRQGRTATTIDVENVSFQCNICGAKCAVALGALGRETRSCRKCNSTVRLRSIIHLLSLQLFGSSIPLPDFPVRPFIKGIGMSDKDGYTSRLAKKVGYVNTYYHKEPRLDITAIDPALEATLDFVISTDVFEHILPPVSVAFENTLKLLKPGGVFIFTVPYAKGPLETQEHFPDLHKFEIAETKDGSQLHNITKDGVKQVFKNPVFHGGEGTTLETRLFSEYSVQQELYMAGFKEVTICGEAFLEFGIYWPDDWSLPIVAKKGVL